MTNVALHIICKGTKDEIDEIETMLIDASPYVEHIYLTVTREEGMKPVSELADKTKNTTLSFFEWTGRFDEARNFNFAQSTSRYKFWLDIGDRFQFSRLEEIDLEAQDSVWLKYQYAFDEQGRCIGEHWRERIIDTRIPYTWKGWVHETLISDVPQRTKRYDIPVVHYKQDKEGSIIRNHEILEKAYEATRDPRYIHYLALSYYTQKDWRRALELFTEYMEVGGWDEEKYRSLLRMSESAAQLDKRAEALNYALQAAGLMPAYPWAYYNLAEIEFQLDNWEECLEWLRVAFSKPEPETAAIYDPTIPEKAKIIAAMCEFMLGDARKALQILETVQGEDTADLKRIYQEEANREVQAAVLKETAKYVEDITSIWEQLPDDFKYDNKYRFVREVMTKPKTWPKKSIVFFCGKGYEEWGPHTLDKGMGGSEEAIVYLTPELAKLGYDVTVYGEVKEEYKDRGVTWRPWRQIDKRDHFDTLVIWRSPQLVTQFNANKILIDVHDLLPKDLFHNYPKTHYMFKSDYHAKQYGVENYSVISNGIKEKY